MRTAPLRTVGRIAWRNARRNARRSALVVAMVALPVSLAVATATVARTIVGTPEEDIAATMGSADLLLNVGPRFDRGDLGSRLPPGSRVVVMRMESVELVREGELLYATLVEPDQGLGSPLLDGMYDLGAGRTPQGPGEAAVNQRILDAFDAEVGDELEFGDHHVTVTGIAVARDLDDAVAVVGEGTLRTASDFANVLIDLPQGTPATSVVGGLKHQGFNTRDEVAEFAARDALAWEAVSVVGGILALFCTGLIAAAAFVVGARRQLREIGLVGAVGGRPRHARAVVWLGGTSLGLVGGILGSIAGVAFAFALHPLLPGFVGRVVGPIEVNPLVVLAVVVIAVVAATLAALAPARAAGKLSVMEALAGRMAPPRAPGRVVVFGIVVLLGGSALTAWATVESKDDMLAAGVVGMLVGVLFAIPLLVSTIGRFTNFLPATGRLAARDAARHGRKTGAAVAAGVIALAIPVAVSAYSLSEETYERRSPRLLDQQLLIGTSSEIATEASTQEIAADFEDAFPGAFVVPLAQAVSAGSGSIEEGAVYVGVRAPGELGGESSSGVTIIGWPLFVGDSAMLRAIGAEEGSDALEEGRAVVLGGYETGNGSVRIRSGGSTSKVAATAVDSPEYLNESIPKVVISPEVADRLGLDTQVSAHLLSDSAPMSSEDIARAREIADRHPGVFVRSNDDYLPKYAVGRAAATAASLPLGLGILAVAVALVSSESRRSHQILVAVGAGPLAHRKVVAATAALLSTITAILAVPAGFLPTAVVQMANQSGRPVVVPWVTIGIVLLVVPLLSALVAALVARTPKLGTLLTPAT
jgi:putative ABC transport system permease protein